MLLALCQEIDCRATFIMFARVFLAFFAGLFCVRNGESIKCYSYACSNYTTTPHPTCSPPKVITCQEDHDSLIPPDRCMIQRVKGEPGTGASVDHEIRGCSDHLKCQSTRLCDDAKNHDNVKHCQTTCCEGDLCNRDGPVARQVTEQKGPTGSNLFCYACSNVTEPGQIPGISCSHPIKQRCGIDPLTGQPQDYCLTIVMSRKLAWPVGKVLYQEIRNCSSSHYCSSSFCAQANVTGNLATCKAECCKSSMCNNYRLPTKISTVTPTTAIQEEKFARQGVQPFHPTEENRSTKAGTSCRESFFQLKTLLGVITFISILFA